MIRYYTAAEIAQTWGKPVGTVHRLASANRWRRVGDGRRPALYDAEEVDRTMSYINLRESKCSAVRFIRRDGRVSDSIIVPGDSEIGVGLHEIRIVLPLGEERVIVWNHAWSLNGVPQPEPAWGVLAVTPPRGSLDTLTCGEV